MFYWGFKQYFCRRKKTIKLKFIMKKLLLSAAVAVLGLSQMNAQDDTVGGFNKGDFFVSGQVNFNARNNDDFKSTDFSFSPSVGYFVSDNVALDLGVSIGSYKNDDDYKSKAIGSSIGATYYFTPKNRFSFNVRGGVGYFQGKETEPSYADYEEKTFRASIAPGFVYFVSNRLALNASLAALYYENETRERVGNYKYKVSDLGLSLDLSNVYFGVTYKL